VNQPPPFPEPLRYLWEWFQELRTGVQGNGQTYPVITWEAIYCWSQLTHQEVSPRDARVIVALSNSWSLIMQEKLNDAAKP
jgi:hypothetical protein